jgi:hypothetical protein
MYLPIPPLALILALAPTKGRAGNYAASSLPYRLHPYQYRVRTACSDGAGSKCLSQVDLGTCIANNDGNWVARDG